MQNILRALPDVVSGYSLDKLQFSVILPVERTNLILNPSFETNTTGYTLVDGAVLTRTTELQRRGVFSLRVKPGVSNVSGLYYTSSALTAGNTYAFSLDVWIRASRKYRIRVFDGARTIVTKKIVGRSVWQRIEVMFTAVTTGAHRLYLEKDDNNDTENFFTDGWQLELCAAGNFYPTTYLDGDQEGFVLNQFPPAYYWNGPEHASISTRSGQTTAGGRVVSFLHYGVIVLSVIGLGFSPVANVSFPYGSIDGSNYQRTNLKARQFTLATSISGKNIFELLSVRQLLESLVSPRNTTYNQPIVLQVELEKGNGNIITIPCFYKSGMEGITNNYNQERIGLSFDLFDPSVPNDGDTGLSLNYQTSVLSVSNIARRLSDGTWDNFNGGANSNILAIIQAPDGNIYAGGNFTSIGGVTVSRVARYDGVNWQPMGGLSSGGPGAFAVAADGTLYAGGGFTSIGGVTASGIAKWDGTTWSAMGAGVAGGSVLNMAIGRDGTLYIVGSFTSVDGIANTNGVAKWNGTAWSAMGTGASGGQVAEITIGLDDSVYVGGDFTLMGGVADTVRVARWSGSAWSALGTGGAAAQVGALATGPDGTVWIGGSFSTIGGQSISKLAKWNGTTLINPTANMNGNPQNIFFDVLGNMYVIGTFTSAGGVPLPDKIAVFNGTSWHGLGIDLPSTPNPIASILDFSGVFYVGGGTFSGTAIAEAVTDIEYDGFSPTQPRITLTGPGTIYQILNTTTGRQIYFNLTLSAGEKAILNLAPGNIFFQSNLRGNILGTIIPSSDLATFALQPGINSISILISGTTSSTTSVLIQWKNRSPGLSGLLAI